MHIGRWISVLLLHKCTVLYMLSCICSGQVNSRFVRVAEVLSSVVSSHPCFFVQPQSSGSGRHWTGLVAWGHVRPCKLTSTFGVFLDAFIGGMSSIVLDIFVNISFLVALMSSRPLVQSYISMTNLSIIDSFFSLMFCVVLNSSKASVASEYTAPTSQAVLLPFPLNPDTVSYPLNAWKMGKTADFSGHIASTTL